MELREYQPGTGKLVVIDGHWKLEKLRDDAILSEAIRRCGHHDHSSGILRYFTDTTFVTPSMDFDYVFVERREATSEADLLESVGCNPVNRNLMSEDVHSTVLSVRSLCDSCLILGAAPWWLMISFRGTYAQALRACKEMSVLTSGGGVSMDERARLLAEKGGAFISFR